MTWTISIKVRGITNEYDIEDEEWYTPVTLEIHKKGLPIESVDILVLRDGTIITEPKEGDREKKNLHV